MSETVSLEFELNSPIERVWRALTDPAMLSQWMMFETHDFKPTVGHKFQFRGKPETGWTGVVECEVLEADAPHRLCYTWETDGQVGRHRTTVLWTLSQSEKGATQLHLEQSGFARDAKQEIGGATYGWQHQVSQLKNLIEE